MWSYLNGEIPYDEMVYRGVCATRQLAKRQVTLRGWEGVHWLDSEQPEQALNKYYRLLVRARTERVQLNGIVRNF